MTNKYLGGLDDNKQSDRGALHGIGKEVDMKMMKQLDIKNYSLSRIPRPGDDRISMKEANVDRTWREWWNGK